jgi:Fic family protein
MFDPARPHNDLPLLPPRADVESHAILKRCIEARTALAEFKTAGELLPNQGILINTIPLLEAHGSSAIENIVTTTDALFRHAAIGEHSADPQTREALHYRTALYEGFKSLARRPLSTATAVEVCSTIKGAPMDIRRIPGTTLTNTATQEPIYTPPVGEAHLRDLLGNWEAFLHNETALDPLIRMATGHYQFEAIHPFLDGNGRTGRILNLLFLVSEGLLYEPTLYLSQYIVLHKNDYYRLLLNVTREGAWEPWILFMLTAVEHTARWASERIAAVRDLQRRTAERIQSKAPRVYSRELLDLLFVYPYCRIADIVDAQIAKRQTAATYLRELCRIGVLKELQVGREKVFIHPKLLAIFEAPPHKPSRRLPMPF